MNGPTETGHIVLEYTVSNTRIRIADDSCRDKTPEDVELILMRIAEQVSGAMHCV